MGMDMPEVFHLSFLIPAGALVSTTGAYCAIKAKMNSPPCSTMVTLLMICSCFAALVGFGRLYDRLLYAEDKVKEFYHLLVAPHHLARSMLSSASMLVLINKTICKLTFYTANPRQIILAIFGLLALVKISVITILPQLETTSSPERGNQIAAILECFETLIEMICMVSLISFWLYRRIIKGTHSVSEISGGGSLAGSNNSQQIDESGETIENCEYPPGWIFLITRISLLLHQVATIKKDFQMPNFFPFQSFIWIHSIFIPIITLWSMESTKHSASQLLGHDETTGQTNGEQDNSQESIAMKQENPGSVPTRPSSVTLPQLLPGAPEIKRIKYISNLRHHSSALETVIAAPRLRKGKKGGKGPLDSAMLDMVGEKIIPLEESESEEESNCKQM